MKKKLPIHELRTGMYVSQLDRPWVGTPFLFQGFEITSEHEIDQLREYCQFVYVDSNPPERQQRPQTKNKPNGADHHEGRTRILEIDLASIAHPAPTHEHRYPDQISLEEEIGQAREFENKARDMLYTIIDDIRQGRKLNATEAKQAVGGMVESVIRNPDALVWMSQLKKRDEYTAIHSLRVCILALTFGRHLEFTAEQLNILGIGALLHDIGKIKVPLDILNKPGRLTDQEFEIMKSHVPHGVKILQSTHDIPPAAIEVARCHHERYSGKGYINGLNGDQIGMFGLIGAIVDCYDAITSDRAYHAGLSPYDALKKLYESRNTDFHPGLVEQFIQCMGIYPIGSIVEMNTGSVGVVITVNRERRLRPKVALVLNSHKQAYPQATILDLMRSPTDSRGRVIEIRKILPSGAYNIRPTSYLPTTA